MIKICLAPSILGDICLAQSRKWSEWEEVSRGESWELLERDSSERKGSLPNLHTHRGGGRANWGTKLKRMACTGQPGLFATPKKQLFITSACFLVLLLAEVALYPWSHGVCPWELPELPWSWDQECTWRYLLLNHLMEFRLVILAPIAWF